MEIAEGTELASVECKSLSVSVAACYNLTEKDLVISDVVLVDDAALDLGKRAMDRRQPTRSGDRALGAELGSPALRLDSLRGI